MENCPCPSCKATEGADGFDTSKLLSTTGKVALDIGFVNTASCTSEITYIDGDAGILRYRGYPIDQLAEQSSFLEVTYLLIYGELPTADQLGEFDQRIRRHTLLHEDLKQFFKGFPRDAHPMPVLSSAVSALSTFYQDSLDPFDEEQVEISTLRLLAKLPTIAAYAYKKSVGQPFLYPDNSCGLVENFLRMTFGFPAEPYEQDPDLVKALDMLFILHADHEQNCSTSTVRLVGSSHANLFASVSAGINALFGPLHGGANQSVLEMLEAIQRDGGDIHAVRRAGQEQGARRQAHGLRPPGLQELRPARGHREVDRRHHPGQARRQQRAARPGPPARGDRAEGRLLRRAQALSERRLLHRADLPGDGLPDPDVHGAVRPRPAPRLDRPVARDDRRPDAPRSAARARCTSARPSGTSSPSTAADTVP